MCTIRISGKHADLNISWTIQQSIIDCLMSAGTVAAAAFVNEFLTCISRPETPTDYTPGDRVRCTK